MHMHMHMDVTCAAGMAVAPLRSHEVYEIARDRGTCAASAAVAPLTMGGGGGEGGRHTMNTAALRSHMMLHLERRAFSGPPAELAGGRCRTCELTPVAAAEADPS